MQTLRAFNCIVFGAALAAPVLLASTVQAIELRPGDVLTAGHTYFFDGQDSADYPAVVRVDPVTREHAFLSGNGVGNGPELLGPSGIAVKGNSTVFVSDGPRILRIDPATGDRSILSGAGIGAGPTLASASSLWLRDDNSLLVLDYVGKSIFSIDATSGDRTLISSPTVGAGAPLMRPNHITTTLDGRILVTSYAPVIAEDVFNGFVVAIDPVTGDRSIFSDATHGSGPGYVAPIGIARRANGKILVADDWRAKIFEVDPATGEQRVFTENVLPSTPGGGFGTPRGVAQGPDGTVYFLDGDFGLMFVAPTGGWATRIPGDSGIELLSLEDLTVVQVPEPSTFALAALGIVLVASLASRQRRAHGQRD